MQSENVPVRAQKARALLQGRRFGVLATNSTKKEGFPFGSVTPYSVDSSGRPLFLFSTLALHTKNLLHDPKASLMVFDREAENDALNSARMNMMGEVHPVPEDELAAAKQLYAADHPDSAQWIDFGDFTIYRLDVADVYFVAGFGEMGWVSKGDFQAAGTPS